MSDNKPTKVLQCIELLPGQSLIIFNTPEALTALYDAVSDAQTYTGRDFETEIFTKSFIVKN